MTSLWMEDASSVHDIVHEDQREQDMYKDIQSIPLDNEDTVSSMMAVVHKHVAEENQLQHKSVPTVNTIASS